MNTWVDQQEAADPNKITTALRAVSDNPEKFARVASYGAGDVRYTLWLVLVDQRVTRAVGLGLFDLGDWNMRDAYEDGESPAAAALTALQSDDTYSAMFGDQ